MDTLNLIINLVLFLLVIARMIAALATDSEVSEIKHIAWATLLMVSFLGGIT